MLANTRTTFCNGAILVSGLEHAAPHGASRHAGSAVPPPAAALKASREPNESHRSGLRRCSSADQKGVGDQEGLVGKDPGCRQQDHAGDQRDVDKSDGRKRVAPLRCPAHVGLQSNLRR
jgi:hypothetical protein